MEQFFYTETMTVMNADADFRSLLKPSALLRYVEQISTDHARAFGMDDQFFKDRGVTFLVGKQALKFARVPQRAETLTLTVEDTVAAKREAELSWLLHSLSLPALGAVFVRQ